MKTNLVVCISIIAILNLIGSCNSLPATADQRNFSGISIADSLLTNISEKYNVEKYGLLLETYPVNPENTVTYLAEGSAQRRNQEVSFLWPYSGMLSGVIALYKNTGDEKYLKILEDKIIPGLELYWDDTRAPYCYQSYPMFNGESDRFYDDNDWIAIDFCHLYDLTGNSIYLEKAIQLHENVYSGWDDVLGGGIYWCEQQKTSKNTCSNAPATVLCMLLYKATGEKAYLQQAIETYNWTKTNLQDPGDLVYWDNIRLDGSISKAKYTYNVGQMIQSGVLLYQATGDMTYLTDAQGSAKGAYAYFTKEKKDTENETQLFYPDSPWFNVILSRGLIALAEIDQQTTYIDTMIQNALHAWQHTRDENGLLGSDWAGRNGNKYKWLLDNACMIEFFAETNKYMK